MELLFPASILKILLDKHGLFTCKLSESIAQNRTCSKRNCCAPGAAVLSKHTEMLLQLLGARMQHICRKCHDSDSPGNW